MSSPVERLREEELVVLLFHGVVEDNSHPLKNYNRKHIEKDYFAKTMAELKSAGHALSMDEVVELTRAGEPYPPRSFAVTFDDGFANNYTVAAPILNDLGLPATFYVTTDYVDRNRVAWHDSIEYCLSEVGRVELKFPWAKAPVQCGTFEEKRAVMEDIRHHIKRSPDIDPDEFADEIFDQCGVARVHFLEDEFNSKMTWRQVAELASTPGFLVGGHTHTHAIMSFLDELALAGEIDHSLSLLEEKCGLGARHYSYPEGMDYCYSESVIASLKERGVVCCPTAIDGTNALGTDLFHLKRIMVI